MGNCFKSSRNDNVSLIRGNDRADARHGPTPASEARPVAYEDLPWMPTYHPSPGVTRPASQMTEEDQVKVAQKLGLISHLPVGTYDGTNKQAKECVICMNEFMLEEQLRYLPCMHIYHKDCIDDWLMRSFTCPSCLEPVDAALLTSYQTG
ncbi:unnamed protein product [Candidula unifasciata]|uniref:RING-type domain-containing protein n=1 Tax=Candidula unifasciata TaxID=100452 RepID=A0A8S3YN72_9EUPU|nr:unnamed protein product [Candidula unifasciata]